MQNITLYFFTIIIFRKIGDKYETMEMSSMWIHSQRR